MTLALSRGGIKSAGEKKPRSGSTHLERASSSQTRPLMARTMGCDGDLAGEIVVVTSIFSILTIFLWIFGLKQFGLL